ncbi:MAG: hypothetical protein GY906_09825 [bacterium]|nr:hypothetical protein [bacterium]
MESERPLSDEARREIEQLLGAGRKIEAIKVYREDTGIGLAEAKGAVERISGAIVDDTEMSATPIKPSSGCLGVIVLSLVTTGLLAGVWMVVA